MRILLVEDDTVIAATIKEYLERTEFRCDVAIDLEAAQDALLNHAFEAMVLDLNLPDGCGLTLLQGLRRELLLLPVLVLTARNTLMDRLTGLDLGADDYLAKPFDLAELLARLRAIHRRSQGRTDQQIQYMGLDLRPSDMTAVYEGRPVDIPVSQYRLLQYLIEQKGRLRTKKQIIEALYSWDNDVAENTVEVYVSQLRKLLWPDLIKTVRGVGYLVPKTA
ncbi:MAG: response regulator transcription factor [Sulfitobacter sp.]